MNHNVENVLVYKIEEKKVKTTNDDRYRRKPHRN